jgi:hypothetical protein
MLKILAIAFALVFFNACKPDPFQIRPITDKGPRQIPPSDQSRSLVGFDASFKHGLTQRYKKVHSPSFAIIHGFYRLPKASPYGAATVVRGYSYQTHLESVHVESKELPFALTPLDGEEAVALNESLNTLLDMGVKIHEISMNDALSIAHAEEQAMKDKKNILWFKHLGPTVDYLMSIYKSQGPQGPIMVGRVIGKDGRLLAFRVMHHGSSPSMLSKIVLSLFEDTINRL